MSPNRAFDPRTERKLLRITRHDRRDTTAEISSITIVVTRQYFSTRSAASVAYGITQPPVGISLCNQQRLQWAQETGPSELDHKRMEESCMVRRITFSDPSHWRGLTNMPVFRRGHVWGSYIIVWTMFLRNTLGPIIPIEHSLMSVCYLNIVGDQGNPFMTTTFLAGYCTYQRDNATRYGDRIVR